MPFDLPLAQTERQVFFWALVCLESKFPVDVAATGLCYANRLFMNRYPQQFYRSWLWNGLPNLFAKTSPATAPITLIPANSQVCSTVSWETLMALSFA